MYKAHTQVQCSTYRVLYNWARKEFGKGPRSEIYYNVVRATS